MARFTNAEAAAIAAIGQVVHEWGDELDANSGRGMTEAGVLTQDCRYFVGGEWREGLAQVQQFYDDRWDRLQAAGGAPVMRHIISNLRIGFEAEDRATVRYLLIFFAKAGEPPFIGYCDPLAVADVRMDCRRDAEGDWRIALFESGQIFQRG
jgi:hypothetical protein